MTSTTLNTSNKNTKNCGKIEYTLRTKKKKRRKRRRRRRRKQSYSDQHKVGGMAGHKEGDDQTTVRKAL